MRESIVVLCLTCVGLTSGQEFRVIVPATVQVMLSSADEQRVGYSSVLDSVFLEIPESGYSYGSIGSIEDNDNTEPDDFYELYVNQEDFRGEFRLTVYGVYAGKYYLEISKGIVPILFRRKSYVSQGGNDVFILRLESKSIEVVRALDKNSLRNDLAVAFHAGDIGKKPLYSDLTHRVSKYEGYLAKNDSAKARQELEKFDKKVEEVFGKTAKGAAADPHHFIKEDAYWILKEDVKRLLD